MKIYLVTGGAGFIGSNFILYMLSKYNDIKIINLDKLTYAGNLENLKDVENNSNHIFVQGDICDKELVEGLFEKYDINYVLNFAAESHVDRGIREPEVFVKTNILGTVTLLNAAKNSWETECGFKQGRKYLQVSTDEVYGSSVESGLFMETTPLDAHSLYSSSKAGSDLMVKAYFDTYKMPTNITRCSNNYGPYEFPENLIPLLINNCLSHKDLPVYGDGLNIRDWLYVEDHCKAIDMVLKEGRLGEIYNVGGHNEITNVQIVKTIISYINEHVDKEVTEDLIKYIEDSKGDDRRYDIDLTKIKEELGWYPETTFEVGIKKTLNWYLDNTEWLKNVTSGDYQKHHKNNLIVSINCITYNHEKYIAEAIESFLMQKTNFKFEIIIYDDASTDNTANIIKQYQKKYPDIIKPILQKENQYSKGVSIFSTYSFPISKGKYIALCEGDDYWIDPYKLQKQVNYMQDHPDCTFCFTNGKILDESGKESERIFLPYSRENKPYFTNSNRIYNTGELGLLGFIPTATFFFPRKILKDLPNFFYQSFPASDIQMKLMFTSKGYAYYINDVTSVYRINVPDSATTRWREYSKEEKIRHNQGFIDLIDLIDEYTNNRYLNEFNKLKTCFEFGKLMAIGDKQMLKSEKYKRLIQKLALKQKIMIYSSFNFPKIYSKLVDIKRIIKEKL